MISECYSGKTSRGDRCDDGKRSDRMMMDGISKRSAAHGNKHAAAGTKLPSVKQQDDKTRSRRWSLKRRRMAAASPLMVWIIVAAHVVIPLVQCGYITVDVITEVFDLTKRPHAEIFGIIHAIAADAMPRLWRSRAIGTWALRTFSQVRWGATALGQPGGSRSLSRAKPRRIG